MSGYAFGKGRAIALAARFVRDLRGGIAMSFSLALIPLLGCVAPRRRCQHLDRSPHGTAAHRRRRRHHLRARAARGLRDARGRSRKRQRAYAEASIATGAKTAIAPVVTAEVSDDRDAVTIAVSSEVSPIFSSIFKHADGACCRERDGAAFRTRTCLHDRHDDEFVILVISRYPPA